MKFKNWMNRVMEKVVAPMVITVLEYTVCTPSPWVLPDKNEDKQ